MGVVETEAIVLRTYKLADADKIVVALTRDRGVVRGVARGARRLRSRFGAGLEPLTLVEIAYFEKEGRELAAIKRAEITRSHFALARYTRAWEAAERMCALVMEFLPPGQGDERVFRLLRATLGALDEHPDRHAAVERYFEVWLLRLCGFWPDVERCAACGRALDGEARWAQGRLICQRCGTGTALDYETQRALVLAARLGPAEWAERAGTAQVALLTADALARARER